MVDREFRMIDWWQGECAQAYRPKDQLFAKYHGHILIVIGIEYHYFKQFLEQKKFEVAEILHDKLTVETTSK